MILCSYWSKSPFQPRMHSPVSFAFRILPQLQHSPTHSDNICPAQSTWRRLNEQMPCFLGKLFPVWGMGMYGPEMSQKIVKCLNFSHWTSFLQKLYCDRCRQKAKRLWLYWASHLPIWAAVDFTWLSSCASVSYPTPGKGPSELPRGHSLVKTS